MSNNEPISLEARQIKLMLVAKLRMGLEEKNEPD